MVKKKDKKKIKKVVESGIVHIQNTFNNTIVTVTDLNGNTISWCSGGAMNFRGAKKSTPYASQIVTNVAIEVAQKHGLREAQVYVKGPGYGRESAIRTVARAGVSVTLIKDVTGLPHNGCRPRKVRRV